MLRKKKLPIAEYDYLERMMFVNAVIAIYGSHSIRAIARCVTTSQVEIMRDN